MTGVCKLMYRFNKMTKTPGEFLEASHTYVEKQKIKNSQRILKKTCGQGRDDGFGGEELDLTDTTTY